MSTIHTFLVQARERGLNEEQILDKLTGAGWDIEKAKAFLAGDDLVAPSPADLAKATDPSTKIPTPEPTATPNDKPIAVVERYTTRGVEYGIQFLALGIGAVSLGTVLHDLANKALDPTYDSGSWVAMGGAAALVAIPIFVILFLRLKRAETTVPALRRDPSRRKWVQLSLLVSFLWGIWAVVRYLYDLLAGSSVHTPYCSVYAAQPCPEPITSGAYTTLQIIHLIVTLVIAGGIFAYYWIDEHRKDMS